MSTIDVPPPASTPQPGWYPDPSTGPNGAERWWNGSTWSDHTRWRPAAHPADGPSAVRNPAGGPHRAAPQNRRAWTSFGLGVFALVITAGFLVLHARTVWVSTAGVLAIVIGVQALRLRAAGLATAVVPAVLGMVAGGLASLLMLVLLTTPASSDPGYGPAPVSGALAHSRSLP